MLQIYTFLFIPTKKGGHYSAVSKLFVTFARYSFPLKHDKNQFSEPFGRLDSTTGLLGMWPATIHFGADIL
jgi:hypothetical protein